jgi:ABC-2 type transport system ATP-binding protein
MSDIAIEVDDVSKRFRVYREKPTSLKQRILSGRTRAEDFWALRDVSFEIPGGGTMGLIGNNGSGKSTLLKVIAGILRPTRGLVRERGRIAGLIELGAGFHPELTGRENVYLNASFLGLSRVETDRVYDDIVGFAELEGFMDTAVKFFSSGMLVRLGFACAVHVDPEIILIDEVLAVGDEGFQARCLDKVRSFQREGRSIVIVSHALDQIRQLCDQAVMLDHGQVRAIGAPDDVVREMRLTILHHDLEFAREEGSKEVEIMGVELLRDGLPVNGAIPSGEKITIQVDVRAPEPVEDPVVSFGLHDATNAFVFGDDTAHHGLALGRIHGTKRVRFALGPIPVTGGTYWVTLGVHSRDSARVYHVQDQRYSFQVQQADGRRDQLNFPVTVEMEDL